MGKGINEYRKNAFYCTDDSRVDLYFFFFQAEDGTRDRTVTGVQTCALPISGRSLAARTAYDYIVDLLLGVDAVGGSEDYRRKVRGLEDTLSHPADSPDQECHQKDDRERKSVV